MIEGPAVRAAGARRHGVERALLDASAGHTAAAFRGTIFFLLLVLPHAFNYQAVILGLDLKKPAQLAAALACALSAAVCYLQGAARAPAAMDLWGYSAPPRTWLAGGDPYDEATLRADVRDRFRGHHPEGADSEQIANALLPPALVLLAPLALLPDEVAPQIMWLSSMAALLFSCWAMLRLWAEDWSPAERLWVVALLLQSRLIQSVAYRGQPSLVMLAAVLCGLLAQRKNASALAGMALVVAATKFTAALPLAAYWVLQRKWRPLCWAAGLGVLLSLPALFTIGPAALIHGWLDSVRALEHWNRTPGGFHLTSWSAILDSFFPEGSPWQEAASAALLIAAIALAGWRRPASGRAASWRFMTLTALGMIAVYHRAYDAVLLFPAAVLAWEALRDPAQRSPPALVFAGSLLLLLFVLAPQSVAQALSGWLASRSPLLAPVNAWACIAVFAAAALVERRQASSPAIA